MGAAMSGTLRSLHEQLAEAVENLRLIQDRKAQYVLETDVPLQLVKDERRREAQIAGLRSRLARLTEVPCPYRGLEPFEAGHAAFYFGRTGMVKRLVAKLADNSFVAVIGPSGCGKSSLVRAGLVTALRQGALTDSQDWAVRIFRPGRDPLRSLATSLVSLLEPEASEVERMANARRLADYLRDGALSMHDVTGRLRELHPGCPRLLLVADQFEELYTECSDDVNRRTFVQALLAVADSEWMTVVLTLRADFYGRVLEDRSLGERVTTGLVNVLPMDEAERREAIEGPALTTGRAFQEGLVERILEDVADAPGDLPLLEFALTEMWARQTAEGLLTHAAYEAIGEVQGAVARRAETVYRELERQGQGETARWIFLQLTHYGEGTVETRRRATMSDIVTSRMPREAVETVGRTLADARLLVIGRDEATGAVTVEVTHETLIRGWVRLRRWLDEDRAFGLWRERLAVVRGVWEETGRDEGALLRGAPLAEARGRLEERGDDLNESERTFLEESLALRRRERAARERLRWRITTAAVGTAVLLSILVVGVAVLWRRAEDQQRIAVARQLIAQSQTVSDSPGTGLVQSMLLAIESLRRYPTLEGDHTLCQQMSLLHRPVARMAHDRVVWSVDFSPDGRRIASGSNDGTARVWEVATGQEVARMQHGGWVEAVAFSPNGKWVASGSGDGTVRVWEVDTGQVVARMQHDGGVWAVAFSPDGNWVVSGSRDDTARVWETATGREVARMQHEGWVEAVDFSPGAQWVASGSGDGTVRVWEMATGQEVARMQHERGVYVVAFSPDGNWVASGSRDDTARVWETATGREVARMQHEGWVESLAFSPDGRWVASEGVNTVRVWEAATGNEVARMEHAGRVLGLAFSPDGRWVASGSEDHTARVWEAGTGREVARMAHLGDVDAVAFDPSGHWVASGSDDGQVWVWPPDIRSEVARMEHGGWVNTVAFSPVGRWAASGSWDKTVQVWDAATGERVTRVEHQEPVLAVAFSPDGERIVSGSGDPYYGAGAGEARVWDVATGKQIARMGHEEWVGAVAFGLDGRLVASGSGDNSVRVWEADTGREVARMAHEDDVLDVAFSPDGRWIASGSNDRTARVWKVTSGQEVARMVHGGWVTTVAFSPDGRRVASAGSWDKTVVVWEADTGREVARMMHEDDVLAVAFSPDGRWVASGSVDRTARLWEAETGREAARVKHRHGVNEVAFSPDGRWMASVSEDGTLQVADTATGEIVARVEHEQWALRVVAFSPDGRWILSGSGDPVYRELGDARVWVWKPEDLIAEACRRLPRNLTHREWLQYLGDDESYRPTCPNLPVSGD
jgi:WD40 repeat protein/energy-coupling factor transporter ATP-binding protein EcfA2